MKSSPSPHSNDTASSDVLSAAFDVVRFERVGFRYDRGPEILSDVNMRLRRGSFTFLTGASGAGKSTLLKLCYLSHKPSRGLINLFENDVSIMSREEQQSTKRRVGVVLQDFRLIDHLNVFENVALPLRVMEEARQDYSHDVMELLQWVGLGHRMDAMPPTLSGGEQQRAAIARAVIAKPDLLIADEPTGNVDPIIGRRLLRLFSEMNRMGTTILIATHDINLIREMPADILRIKDGQLFQGLEQA